MRILLSTILLVLLLLGNGACTPETPAGQVVDWPTDSIHPSGLVYAEGFPIVRGNCTTCHSAKLVTQNRATRDGWESMIRWMQETQGLHDLGEHEAVILDYLALHFAPVETGRRANLNVEALEWYDLE